MDWLRHQWNDALASTDVLRFVVVLTAALVAAWAVRPLASRWLLWTAPKHERQVRAAENALRLFVIVLGVHEALRAVAAGPTRSTLAALVFLLAVLIAAHAAMRLGGLFWQDFFDRRAVGPEGEKARRQYLPMASMLTSAAVVLLTGTLVAHHFGHDVTSLVTAFGVGSLAIGLAAQQTLGNMVAGFTLLVDRPFVPGDQIRLQSGETGDVLEIGIRSTRIALPDGSRLIVPNAEMANTRVVNRSFPLRAEVRFKVAWPADAERLGAALVSAVSTVAGVEREPAPTVSVVKLESAAVELWVRAHVRDQREREDVEERMRRAVWACVLREKIAMPTA